MTQEELVHEIVRLPIEQRVEIVETVLHGVGQELQGNVGRSAPSNGETTSSNEPRLSQRLYGILTFDGEPPTDDEVKDARADYLMEKYC